MSHHITLADGVVVSYKNENFLLEASEKENKLKGRNLINSRSSLSSRTFFSLKAFPKSFYIKEFFPASSFKCFCSNFFLLEKEFP